MATFLGSSRDYSSNSWGTGQPHSNVLFGVVSTLSNPPFFRVQQSWDNLDDLETPMALNVVVIVGILQVTSGLHPSGHTSDVDRVWDRIMVKEYSFFLLYVFVNLFGFVYHHMFDLRLRCQSSLQEPAKVEEGWPRGRRSWCAARRRHWRWHFWF